MADSFSGAIPIDEEPTNVIVLSEVRNQYRFDKCQHKHVEVDEVAAEVECKDCGLKLNPIAVLVRLSREESRLRIRIEQNKKLKAELDKKTHTKCRHCGQMTPVRVS